MDGLAHRPGPFGTQHDRLWIGPAEHPVDQISQKLSDQGVATARAPHHPPEIEARAVAEHRHVGRIVPLGQHQPVTDIPGADAGVHAADRPGERDLADAQGTGDLAVRRFRAGGPVLQQYPPLGDGLGEPRQQQDHPEHDPGHDGAEGPDAGRGRLTASHQDEQREKTEYEPTEEGRAQRPSE